MNRRALVCCVFWAACSSPESGEEPAVGSVRSSLTGSGTIAAEATIYEDNTGANGGSYSDFCVGNLTSTGGTRRGFIRYTLPAIPAGATVTRVVLAFTQNDVRAMGGGPLSATLEVRRVTSSWTEGAGVSGSRSCGGGSLVAGVNWNTQPTVASTLSGSVALSTANPITVTLDTDVGSGNDGLIADVQAWVDGTANDGWRLSVAEEGTADNARTITPGGLNITWTNVPNGSTCTTDADCANGNCVHSDGNDCSGRSGCVCCDVATCTGDCATCFRTGLVGTCSPAPNNVVCRAASCTGGIAVAEGLCDGTTTQCPGPVALTCTPYTCSGDMCASTCSVSSLCDTGYYCNASTCELIPDGGIPDAGSADAGAADAGSDAGFGDAGTPDAGSDAGTNDAGANDAGTNDAGTSDAGTTDAGTSADAGDTTDAGTSADAGTQPQPDAGTGTPPPNTGCGCGATGAGPLAFALLLLIRRRRTP